MALTRFKVKIHPVVAWVSRNFLGETGQISQIYVTATGFEPTITRFIIHHSTTTSLVKWLRVRSRNELLCVWILLQSLYFFGLTKYWSSMSYYCDTYHETPLHLFYESDSTNQAENCNFIKKETLVQVFSCEF